jgi:hypothetical protein
MSHILIFARRIAPALFLILPSTAWAEEPPKPGETVSPKDLDELREDTARSIAAEQKAIDGLKAEIDRLRKEVDDLKNRAATPSDDRRSRPPSTRESRSIPVPAPRPGAIRLINDYSDPMYVILNGTVYSINPGETRLLRNQPAGAFRYEVPGVHGPRERSLEPDETFTVRIRAR